MLEFDKDFAEKGDKRYRAVIQSVFLPRENILFLKEWLVYHIAIGVEHFYLYDNTGSVGRDGSNQQMNKYGIPYAKITGGMSDNDIQEIMKEIQEELPGRVTYIKWAPLNEQGEIVYGWNEALRDYVEKYARYSDWTAFIDMDEFIISMKGRMLKDHLDVCEKEGITDIVILQKKFDDRFNNLDRYVARIDKCIEGINTFGWGPKHIIRADLIDLQSLINKTRIWDMHNIHKTAGKHVYADINELRFNHYNMNMEQFKWMKWFYNASEDFFFNGQDNGMKDYWQTIENECGRNGTMDLLRRYPSPL